MDSYMCPDCGERCDETVTVRGPFGDDEECLYCHLLEEIVAGARASGGD